MKNIAQSPARWAVGITLAGVVAGASFAAAASWNSGTSATTQTSADTTSSDVATLLSAQAGATAATSHNGKLPRLHRVRIAGGMYGEITYRTRQGTDRTLGFERGTIVSVSGSALTVRAADGTTMTWTLLASTTVREHGAKVAESTLAAGQRVFVGGPLLTQGTVASAAKDAVVVVIRTTPPAASGASAS